jgi:hypothetical protein
MILLNPKNYDREHRDPKVKEMMQKTIDFFEKKGLKKIKEDDQASIWYDDFLEFIKQVGELFTLIPYAQLICENKKIYKIDDSIIEEIFNFLVRDFSAYALSLYTGQDNTPVQQELILKMIKKPVVDHENFNRVWEQYVYALKGQYTMND